MNRKYRFRCIYILAFVLIASATEVAAAEPQEIRLWPNGAPGAPTKPADEPVLFVYPAPADTATKTAVVICPGGGYQHLAIEKEGTKFAEWFNSFGVTAFVLRYRHGGTGHQHPIPMHDGQRAIRTVRSRAKEFNIDPNRIGVMGFSAGGHMASTLGTHFEAGDAAAIDSIESYSSRPDFLILCYPVITLEADYMHKGSREHLLGKTPTPELVREMSNEFQVTKDTPPTFIFQTDEDVAVPAENCVAFYLALRKAKVPAEMHIYEVGRHGLGLAAGVPGTEDWPNRLKEWLKTRGLLKH